MIVYYTDYSKGENGNQKIAWVKKVRNKRKSFEVTKIIPTDFINGSASGEMLAIYFALLDAVAHRYSTVIIRNDNKPVIETLNKSKRRPRKHNTKFILFLIDNLSSRIKNLSYEWISRKYNKEADALTKREEE